MHEFLAGLRKSGFLAVFGGLHREQKESYTLSTRFSGECMLISRSEINCRKLFAFNIRCFNGVVFGFGHLCILSNEVADTNAVSLLLLWDRQADLLAGLPAAAIFQVLSCFLYSVCFLHLLVLFSLLDKSWLMNAVVLEGYAHFHSVLV